MERVDPDSRWTVRWAWVAWSVAVLAFLGDVYFLWLNGPLSEDEPPVGFQAIEDLAFIVVATLALLVIRAQPRNVIGWWIMLAGLSFPLEGFFAGFTYHGSGEWGATPIVLAAGWVTRWVWIGSQMTIPLTLLYYPDGSLPSRRWRPVVASMWVLWAALFFIAAFDPEPMSEVGDLPNPLGIGAIADLYDKGAVVWGTIVLFGYVLPLLPVLGASSLIPRYRNGTPVVRQQVKYIGLMAVVSVLFFASQAILDISQPVQAGLNVAYTLFVTGVIAAGIVRYRLFDIDRILSRTVTYAIVVGVLAGTVALVATVVSTRFDSPLIVAATTLGVAAAFNPLRRRVQHWVDRRFNRSKYDAERVVDEFGVSLQDGVDEETLVSGWVRVVEETVQPTGVGVWVRDR